MSEPEIYTTVKTLFFEICGHIQQKIIIRLEEFFEIIIKKVHFSYKDLSSEKYNQEINLNKENEKQFDLDCTFRIIPLSLKPYKLMTIYAVNAEKNNTILTCLICIKFKDSQSLIKLFSILKM